jgi:peptidylprolyl isomerase
MADGKQIRDRIFAMSGAILFFVTSIALTVVVIFQIMQDNKNKDAAGKTATAQTAPKEGQLAGTNLEGFEPVAEVVELKVTDLKVGEGKEITSVENTVTADYTGAVAATGKIFQSSLDSGKPFTTQLGGVIKGWQDGMIGMKEGGKRRLVIPAADAYGPNPPEGSGIPANAPLVFDITLSKVE